MGSRTGTPFRQCLNGMPNLGQGSGWPESQWRAAPIRRVRLTDLIATNRGRYLDESIVASYVRNGGGVPCVIERRGFLGNKLYLADGHHRSVAAWRRGETHIRAHVKRLT